MKKGSNKETDIRKARRLVGYTLGNQPELLVETMAVVQALNEQIRLLNIDVKTREKLEVLAYFTQIGKSEDTFNAMIGENNEIRAYNYLISKGYSSNFVLPILTMGYSRLKLKMTGRDNDLYKIKLNGEQKFISRLLTTALNSYNVDYTQETLDEKAERYLRLHNTKNTKETHLSYNHILRVIEIEQTISKEFNRLQTIKNKQRGVAK